MNVQPETLPYAAADSGATFWQRFAADVRTPLWAMVILAVAVSVVFPVYHLVSNREAMVVHISDDAYYYFSVVPYLAAGKGPTADGISRTTGWHPLYGFTLAALYRLTKPSLDGLVREAIALNALLHLLAGGVLFLAARRWWGTGAGVAAALLWLINPHAAKIRSAQLEGSLYAFTLALLLWQMAALLKPRQVIQRARRTLSHCLLLGVLGGLAVLSRTDAILLIPFLALVVLLGLRESRTVGASTTDKAGQRSGWPLALTGTAVFTVCTVVAYVAWLAYVYHYTGELHQGSAAVKMEWRKFQIHEMNGMAVVASAALAWLMFALESLLKVPALKWLLSGIPLLALGSGTDHERRCFSANRLLVHLLWLVPVILGLAYAVLLDRVRTWYYVPALVTLTLLSAGAAYALWTTLRLNPLQRLVRRCLGLIGWAVVIESAVIFGRDLADARGSEQLFAVKAAEKLVEELPAGTRVGCWHSGIIGYYTTPHLDVVNLDGLNNNDILSILRGQKTMNQYWDELGVTFILGQPREKMGNYQEHWGNKRVARWLPEGWQKWSLQEQVLWQSLVRRVENLPGN